MSSRRSALALALLGAVSFAPASGAQRGIILPRCVPTTERRPLPECVPTGARIDRVRTDLRIDLKGSVFEYEVDERFVNNGSRVGEADYLFPLPKGAAFRDLRLTIDGELVAGETMNASDARGIYEDIVRRQRDPALVEYVGQGLLRARIFPINPGEEKRVLVRFQSVAERDGDAIVVRTPAGDRGATSGSLTLTYPSGDAYGRAYSPTHDVVVEERGSDRRATVRGNPADMTLLIPVRRANEASIGVLPYAPGAEDGFVMITVTPPAGSDRATAVTPRDLTLVLDVSGSMAGDKMTQARAAARQVLATLSPRDRFRIVDFATDVHTFRDGYAAVTPETLRDARNYIDDLDANGSTNIEAALKAAFDSKAQPRAGALPIVLFITDGEPTVGERRPDALVDLVRPQRGDPGRIARRVFTFGVGSDVHAPLLEQIALETRATAQFVRPNESVERAVSSVATRLVDPVLTDVSVRVEGTGLRLSRVLPPSGADLFAGQDLVVLGRYTGDGPAKIVVEGSRGGQAVRWTHDARLPERERANPFVARLWATQRVGYLAAEKRRGGGSGEVDREIRELGERYAIPTEFTSYLVLEPGMRVGNGMGRAGGGGGGRGALPPAAMPVGAVAAASLNSPRDAAFEQARTASALREARSLSDSTLTVSKDATGNAMVRIGGTTFVKRDSVWTDVRYAPTMRTVRVKPYSKGWFDVIARIPELKSVFALGDRVIAVGRSVAIEVGPRGVDTLSDADLATLARDW